LTGQLGHRGIDIYQAEELVTNPRLDLLPQNGSQLAAHKDFVEVISTQGIEDLFTNVKKLQPASHTDEILGHLKTLASAKKPVLLIEYPKTAERQALSKKLAEENGFVWLVTDRQLKTLGESAK
jgi:endo-alpha-1,4-polygalactosaminidase (GH114 family)